MAKISDYLMKEHHITNLAKYEQKQMDAIDLLVPSRLDLIAKLKYIQMKDLSLNYAFPVQLYQAHLDAFSNGTFVEPGNEGKNSFDKYLATFDQLIEEMKKNGMDEDISIIPVGKEYAILDGAHRTSIAIYYGQKVPVVLLPDISFCSDAYFFQSRLLNQKYIDYMVLEYAKLKSNVYCFCFWPRANAEQKNVAISLLKQKVRVIYDKEVFLTYQGYKNFMQQIYAAHEWTGSYEDDHKGVWGQVDPCYDKTGKLHLFVVEGNNLDQILKLKQSIRDIFQIGNYSIHSTDNQEETVMMLNLLLNDNSIHMLNHGNPDQFKKFNQNLKKFKSLLEKNHENADDYIIDSSSVLSLYGLREAEDIDFLSISKKRNIISADSISDHEAYLNHYGVTKESLILDPSNYLVYDGIKFITLDVLRQMKKNRGEKKDKEDIKLIDSLHSGKLHQKYLSAKLLWKRKARDAKRHVKIGLIRILKFTRLYDPLKRFLTSRKNRKGN